MADIFLSYAREDQLRARLLAAALESRGWSVWWDRRILPGKDFNLHIEQQLNAAACIVVLWSKASISSAFVRDEATEGLSDGRLVPALIDTVRQPLGFRQLHAADLTDWRNGASHDEFDRLVDSIDSIVGPSVAPIRVTPELSARHDQTPASRESPPHANEGTKRPTLEQAETDRHKAAILAIDLGTTNAIASLWQTGQPAVIDTVQGGHLMPSVVAFAQNGDRIAGAAAKRQAVTNSRNTVFAVKRLMGRKYDEVSERLNTVPTQTIRAANGDATVLVNGTEYSPADISAVILQELKQAAAEHHGRAITKAVITVPASFNDAQRQATMEAGRIAGLEVVRLVNAPTAAALAYALGKKTDETIAVYHFGGGTFDISILEVGEGVVEVKTACGDSHLGGVDLDQRIVDWLIEEFKSTTGIDLAKDPMAWQRLKEAAEKAKTELSNIMETQISLPFIAFDPTGPKHLEARLTRTRFEQLVEDLVLKTVGLTKQALTDAGVDASTIDNVVLVGGSTRIPRVQTIVRSLFGNAQHRQFNPEESVALGAAIQAAMLNGEVKDLLWLDVTPLSLGVETFGGVMTVLIPKNSTIPTRRSEIFSTVSDNQTSLEIHVLQGERAMARDNWTLGAFDVAGIPPLPRGVPKIEITLDIDANSTVNVHARDLDTGKEQRFAIRALGGVAQAEVRRTRNQDSAGDRVHREILLVRA